MLVATEVAVAIHFRRWLKFDKLQKVETNVHIYET